ncbi:MAG: hypothetical protein CVV56_08180 [Tenericutes bacterium HGW-Tenericutes-1]|jgi:hypothetical protein|nr:MAG: hypothetical protein CVV56_08180 [Tenericutes bacterium HGW-Tenericutes-1]PKM95823.1 MAG: hypothetical protein CVU84_03210 [Firmicutes bacterium HGW-Firmicutes-1]
MLNKERILSLIITLLIVVIGAESYFLINKDQKIKRMNDEAINVVNEFEIQKQKYDSLLNNESKELAEKVIIHSYQVYSDAGILTKNDNTYIFRVLELQSNMKIISNSYSGDDKDIKDMLVKIQKMLDFTFDNRFNIEKMSDDEKSTYFNKSLDLYVQAGEALDICISKYALFDRVGLE